MAPVLMSRTSVTVEMMMMPMVMAKAEEEVAVVVKKAPAVLNGGNGGGGTHYKRKINKTNKTPAPSERRIPKQPTHSQTSHTCPVNATMAK